MDKSKSSISEAQSYQEISEFWDNHDVTDYWEQTGPVEFEINLASETRLVTLEPDLAAKVNEIAWKKGVSLETLLNMWVREKLDEDLGHAV